MNEEKITAKLVETDEYFEVLDDKIDGLTGKVDKLTNGMDKAMVILQRLDQERIFAAEWVRRIERDVEKIKQQLHIV